VIYRVPLVRWEQGKTRAPKKKNLLEASTVKKVIIITGEKRGGGRGPGRRGKGAGEFTPWVKERKKTLKSDQRPKPHVTTETFYEIISALRLWAAIDRGDLVEDQWPKR